MRTRVTTASTALALIVTAAALGSSPTIVAPTGTVAGRNYSQWLAKWWQLRLRVPATGPVCQHAGGVGLVIGPTKPKETDRCQIRHGQAVYVNGPSAECSTLEPPPSHGNTSKQLRRCARRGFARLSGTQVTIDGRPLRHPDRWVVATGVYRLRLPRHNFLGTGKRSGRSAAYGAGFLLTGLSRGVHVIHQTGTAGPVPIDLTYQIEVTR